MTPEQIKSQHEKVIKLAERAANPDASATDKAEICATIGDMYQGEPIISVLQEFDLQHTRANQFLEVFKQWREVVEIINMNPQIFNAYLGDKAPAVLLNFFKTHAEQWDLKIPE